MTASMHDVAVIGAGPYGLAATAHLRARGLDVLTLGRPMELWERQMPEGMFLRSSWDASSIDDPHGALSLDAFEAARGMPVPRPIPLSDFLCYARWFQRTAVPDIDERRVVALAATGGGFELGLADGAALRAGRVVVATGPGDFPRRPEPFTGVAPDLVHHSAEVRDARAYAGLRTAVVGAGQSAVELAALLSEAGAGVEIIARADRVRWLRRSGWLHSREGRLRRMLYPRSDVGPVGLAWVVAVPGGFRRIPVGMGERIAYRCVRPAAAAWLEPRVPEVAFTLGRTVSAVQAANGCLRLRLDDGSRREVDRIVLATGFDVRADRHPLLPAEILSQLRMRDGAPVLGRGLESSVPGLHFAGVFAAASFGPVMRFVSGTPYAARALAAHIAPAPRVAPVRAEAASAAA